MMPLKELTRVLTGEDPTSTKQLALYGLAGTLVMIITSPAFFAAPFIGGLVSGGLRQGRFRDGAIVGCIAGVFAGIPIAILGFISFSAVQGSSAYITASGRAPIFWDSLFGFMQVLNIFLIFIIGAIYLIGCSTVGGGIGSYARSMLKSYSSARIR